MRTHALRLCALLLAASAAPLASAQETVTVERNFPRDGDRLERAEVPFIPPGKGGEGTVWHCSFPASLAKSRPSSYRVRGGQASRLEEGTLYHSRLSGDSLLAAGFENRSTALEYAVPPLLLECPLAYGDSTGGVYGGQGIHGSRLHWAVWGRNHSVADGTGVLTDGTDTLRHILRVRLHREFATATARDTFPASLFRPDSIAARVDTATGKTVENRWLWYKAGCRYPVMETVEGRKAEGGKETRVYAATYLYLPDAQRLGLDSDLANELLEEELASHGTPGTAFSDDGSFPIAMDAQLGAGGKSLSLHYELSAEGPVSFYVYDSTGRLLAQAAYPSRPAGTYDEMLRFAADPVGSVLALTMQAGGQWQTVKVRTD